MNLTDGEISHEFTSTRSEKDTYECDRPLDTADGYLYDARDVQMDENEQTRGRKRESDIRVTMVHRDAIT